MQTRTVPQSDARTCLHTRCAVYPQRLFWCELQSFADICCRDVCLLSAIMQVLVTRDNPQRFLWAVFYVGTISSSVSQRAWTHRRQIHGGDSAGRKLLTASSSAEFLARLVGLVLVTCIRTFSASYLFLPHAVSVKCWHNYTDCGCHKMSFNWIFKGKIWVHLVSSDSSGVDVLSWWSFLSETQTWSRSGTCCISLLNY